MTIAYLNGVFVPLAEAKISPLDRGFLFGDGVYEVVPAYSGKCVGLNGHIERLKKGLSFLDIDGFGNDFDWRTIFTSLIDKNKGQFESDSLGIYLQVSRGADVTRYHAYPKDIAPTCFAFVFEVPPPPVPDKTKVKGLHVHLEQDKRWQRCNIKTTSLLGNVMHFQHGKEAGLDETILFNSANEVTEASSSNVFVVKNGVIATPLLDEQILPGITRQIVISSLEKEGINVEERVVTLDELHNADEVWLTSASKELTPVLSICGESVGKGTPGRIWESSLKSYNKYKFDM